MDIKTLLLKSLSLKRSIHGSRRIHCGKSCIIIKYVINGSIFSIKAAKISRTHETWTQRIKYYKKDLRICRSTKSEQCLRKNDSSNTFYSSKQDKETQTEQTNKDTKEIRTDVLKNFSTRKHSAIQTIDVRKVAKETQTEMPKTAPKLKEIFKLGATTKSKPVAPNQTVTLVTTAQQTVTVPLATSAQQTIASVRFSRAMLFNNKMPCTSSKATSTISNVECKAVQCKRHTQTTATNTDNNTRDSFVQVENDLPTDNNYSLSEELKRRLPLPAEEIGVFIYMLNEIGETVINQNQILKSNTEFLKQIIQLSMLQNSKLLNNTTYRSISTQTDNLASIEKKHNMSQTSPECLKQRKLLLFRGRNNPHKKVKETI